LSWLGLVALASLSGVRHRGYEMPLGELHADQLSNLVLLVLVLPCVARVDAHQPTRSASEAITVGAQPFGRGVEAIIGNVVPSA
jgi:hypothetical protein